MKEIALHILDIAENSLDAGASQIRISLEMTTAGVLELMVDDNGKGMDQATLDKTSDPFFTSRSTRRVGMGIPMLRQHAEMTGGRLEIHSEPGAGTTLKATFIGGHPDIQPLGDIEGCWMLLAAMHQETDILLKCKTMQGEFEISSRQAMAELEAETLDDPTLREDLKRLIRNNLSVIGLTDKIIENK